jgi:hypothetical protein
MFPFLIKPALNVVFIDRGISAAVLRARGPTLLKFTQVRYLKLSEIFSVADVHACTSCNCL